MAFIDEIIQGISKEVNQVKSRSKDMMETFNLNSQIKDLERKKIALYIEIGRMVFRSLSNNQELVIDELKLKVEHIKTIKDEIYVIQEEIDRLNALNNQNMSASQKAKAKAGYSTSQTIKCQSCNSEISSKRNFCPNCGTKTNNVESEDNDLDDSDESCEDK